MGINRKNVGAVVYYHCIAGIKQALCQPDNTRIGCNGRRPWRGAKIYTIVITFQLAVKHPLVAIQTGYIVFNR